MKKLLNVAAVAVALCGLMVSCASSGSSESKAGAPASVHPRSYEIDPATVSGTVDMVWNQYGPNYQQTVKFWSSVKTDKPQAGDTINLKMKFTSDLDIPGMCLYFVDNGSSWTPITDDYVIENIKAGEPVVYENSIVLTKNAVSDFSLCLGYDGVDHGQENYGKAGSGCKFTLEQIGTTTDTANEIPPEPHKAHVDVAVEKVAAFFEIATNHPWINGAQDMSVVSNYQGVCDLMSKYDVDDLPKAGDTLTVTWSAVSDIDIAKINMRVFDNSPAANWWTELDANGGGGAVFVENVKAGEPFTGELTMTFEKDAIGGVALNIWYDLDDAEGPATIKLYREKK